MHTTTSIPSVPRIATSISCLLNGTNLTRLDAASASAATARCSTSTGTASPIWSCASRSRRRRCLLQPRSRSSSPRSASCFSRIAGSCIWTTTYPGTSPSGRPRRANHDPSPAVAHERPARSVHSPGSEAGASGEHKSANRQRAGACARPQLSLPDRSSSTTNSAYTLLAAIVARVSGQTFTAFSSTTGGVRGLRFVRLKPAP